MSFPWAKITHPGPLSLSDIISEEITHLKAKKSQECISNDQKEMTPFGSDEMISSPKITEQRYTELKLDFESESDDDEMEAIMDQKEWDRIDSLGKVVSSNPPTKSDLSNIGRVDTRKLPFCLPEFEPDLDEEYKKPILKVPDWRATSSDNCVTRNSKAFDRELAASDFKKDSYTRIILYKMIHHQILKRINGIISIGKETAILHADGNLNYPETKQPLPQECVIKVFKNTLSELKQTDKYIKDNCRFKDRIVKQMAKERNNLCAEKEMTNLMRLARAGLNCPQVIALKKHLLVMSFIGKNRIPAPKLKYAKLSPKEYVMAYDEIIEGMRTLYEKANLIHANLNEYNILWHDKKCYFIDVSQSVESSHENARDILYADCYNIVKFFTKRIVPDVYYVNKTFQYVIGNDNWQDAEGDTEDEDEFNEYC